MERREKRAIGCQGSLLIKLQDDDSFADGHEGPNGLLRIDAPGNGKNLCRKKLMLALYNLYNIYIYYTIV